MPCTPAAPRRAASLADYLTDFDPQQLGLVKVDSLREFILRTTGSTPGTLVTASHGNFEARDAAGRPAVLHANLSSDYYIREASSAFLQSARPACPAGLSARQPVHPFFAGLINSTNISVGAARLSQS